MAATDSYAGGDGRLSPLSTPSATRAVLEAHGIGTKYTLGQNFLVNDDVLKKIIALAEVGENDRVLEVGPGIGTLTIALLKHAASVIAIERDPDLPAVLADTLHPWREKFALIEKDALDVTRDDIVAAMAEIGGDTGYPDSLKQSSLCETAHWAVSFAAELARSGHPPAPWTSSSVAELARSTHSASPLGFAFADRSVPTSAASAETALRLKGDAPTGRPLEEEKADFTCLLAARRGAAPASGPSTSPASREPLGSPNSISAS